MFDPSLAKYRIERRLSCFAQDILPHLKIKYPCWRFDIAFIDLQRPMGCYYRIDFSVSCRYFIGSSHEDIDKDQEKEIVEQLLNHIEAFDDVNIMGLPRYGYDNSFGLERLISIEASITIFMNLN